MLHGMKTVTRKLAYTEVFVPDGTIITKADLADYAETFDGKCPVSLGHKLADGLSSHARGTSDEKRAPQSAYSDARGATRRTQSARESVHVSIHTSV